MAMPATNNSIRENATQFLPIRCACDVLQHRCDSDSHDYCTTNHTVIVGICVFLALAVRCFDTSRPLPRCSSPERDLFLRTNYRDCIDDLVTLKFEDYFVFTKCCRLK